MAGVFDASSVARDRVAAGPRFLSDALSSRFAMHLTVEKRSDKFKHLFDRRVGGSNVTFDDADGVRPR
ncbi:hypothetical protein GCM10028864_40340 [Microlunatus parietis]